MKRTLKIALAASLVKSLLVTVAFGDVTWRGTGTVTTNSNALIRADVGDTVAWSIEYGEVSLEEEVDDQALKLSIQFVINSQTVRLDSPHKRIDNIHQGLVNWSLADSDNLSHIAFPSGAMRTVMTMRVNGGNIVDGPTYSDLRNPSFDMLDRFFGFIDTGVGAPLFFDVDIGSIEILEHFNGGSLAISIPEPGVVDLSWPVLVDGRYRVEASPDLGTFFNIHKGLHTQPVGVFTERNLTARTRFYRLLRLSKIFPD